MREVYASINTSEVNLRRTLLEEAGIPTFVRNEALSSLGSLLIGAFQPALCVMNDGQYGEAMALLRTMGDSAAPTGNEWLCPKCEEPVPGTFDSCWKCETLRPGSDQPAH